MKKHFLSRLVRAAAAAALAVSVFAAGVSAYALSGSEFRADYKFITFTPDTGLDTFEINDIVQTFDGYIWAGSYSGLLRYDGKTFENIKLGEDISNVRCLFVDSTQKLWIGTNDSGAYRYDVVTGSMDHYTTAEGLGSNMIRSMCEDDSGRIYIGTAGALSVLLPDGTLSGTGQADLVNVDCLSFSDGKVCAVTTAGNIFFASGGRFKAADLSYDGSGIYYTRAAFVNGCWYFGTSAGTVLRYDGKGEPLLLCELPELGSITCMLPYGEDGGCFVCGYGGFGFLTAGGEFTALGSESFHGSVSAILADNQGNVWFASDKLGISKLSPNPFENCFAEAELSDKVVNSVIKKDGCLYLGCDDGLYILEAETNAQVTNELTEALAGIRIRHIMQDSRGNLWFSAYGGDGLLCYGADGSYTWYSESNSAAIGMRFRSTLEMSDGTIAAAGTMGITFIRDGEVVSGLSAADGLAVPQILTMYEREDGVLLAGSDGDGIYMIKDGELIGRIGEEQGLNTAVILRIVKCTGGFIYVTSNAMYYDSGDAITRLTKFPYSNNYDVCNIGGGTLWISSSRGIYIVSEAELLANEEYDCILLNRNRGFDTTLTANAWNYLDEDGSLYLCCSDGIRKVSVYDYNDINGDYEIALKTVVADDAEAEYCLPCSSYTVPAGTSRIVIYPAVLNFTLTDPEVHMYMEGFDSTGVTIQQSELMPMTYTNLPGGSYRFHIQVIDEKTGAVNKEHIVNIVKEKAFYEQGLFVFGCIVAFCAVVVSITLVIAKLSSVKQLRRQIEETQKAKDEAEQATLARGRFLANMSHEIRTPINTIIGMNEMILRESEDDTIEEYAQNIKSAGKTLLDLVDNVLNYSKIESGSMEIINGEYDLKEMLGYLVNVLHSRTDPKNLEVKLNISPTLPRKLSGDEIKIKQIAANLLTNAAKYTEKGYVKFSVYGKWADTEVFMLHMSVEDTGSGIKPENFNKLFDSFTRFDEAKHRTTEGTGLGLSITKQLTKLMHGEISVKSTYGVGSVFEVTLPQRVISRMEIGEFSAEHAPSGQVRESFIAPSANLLVVDDNKMNLSVMKLLLKRIECSVDLAESGEQCLELCQKKRYDLILMDHMMPGMDGIECLEKLRAQRGSPNEGTQVIVLTANATAGIKNEYIRQGFSDYLSKPVDVAKLEKMLIKYLPEAKIKRVSGEEKANPALTEKRISGLIDREMGLRYCAGSEEMYAEVLSTYHEQGIKYFSELPELFSERRLSELAIIVHAIKSTSMTIGAAELSEQAKQLEEYAKAGDEQQVAIIRDSFMLNYERVLDAVGKLAGKTDEQPAAEKQAVSDEDYRAMCGELLEKIRGFEMSEAQELLEKLGGCAASCADSQKAQAAIADITKALDDFDYDSAEQRMNEFIKELG